MGVNLVSKKAHLVIQKDMLKGDDGGYYIPSVDEDGNLIWTPSQDDMWAVEGANIKGAKGDKGDTGAQGERGVAGADGKDGTNGADGTDGYTPVRGTDYWTEADKAEIVAATLAALPVYDGEVI